MARVIMVHGYGHFVVTLEEGDPFPVRLAPAPADLVAAEETWGNIQVIVPFRSLCDQPGFERCPVELGRWGEESRVAGVDAPTPKGVAYRALLALTKSFPGGLSREALNVASAAGDARNALRDLAEAHPLWRAAIRFPRQNGDYRQESKGYRIAGYAEVVVSMTELVDAGQIGRSFLSEALDNSESFKVAG
jgi:hypothetical protein